MLIVEIPTLIIIEGCNTFLITKMQNEVVTLFLIIEGVTK